MTQKFIAACIQNCATNDVTHNIKRSSELVRAAAAEGARFAALPEYFSGVHVDGLRLVPAAFEEDRHPVISAFADLARDLDIDILLGSLGVKAPDGRIFNRGYMVDRSGAVTARYSKIHMFDVNLGEGAVIQESATIAPGDEAVLASACGATLGLSICYDLRFAALYRTLAQAGAEVLAVPAAFTKVTGQAHWHVLNRARAIENGCFVVAPCQTGTLSGGAECFGHSLIINPWGEVLADGGEQEGYCLAEIDIAEVADARRRIPSLQHDRAFAPANAPAVAAE